jgi:Flp pilus assembly protein TadG
MLGSAIFSRTRRAANRFAAARNGNVAVIFALAAVPLISFMGVAIDYSRANSARSSMQAALDSTALMVAKDLSSGIITPSDINSKSQAYFTALYTNSDAKSVAVSAVYTAASGPNPATIKVNGSGVVNTDFLKLAGYPSVNFGTSSTSTWGINKMRVAMALDNTGSMANDGKIAALRTAAANLVDQLSALNKSTGDVYISVVPFAKDVNVGASNYNQTWIDWTDWENNSPGNTYGSCSNNSYSKKSRCENNGATWTPDHSKWTGCVTDRTQPYDTQSTTPVATNVATLFPAEEYYSNGEYYCKPGNSPFLQPILSLSNDWTGIKTMINAMQPTGGTNQPIGLAWAWQSLQTGAPLNAPAEDSNYTYTRAIILLSDGLNTQDRWPAYGDGQNQFAGQIDARQRALCDNIKAVTDQRTGKPAYTIYTIQVNTGSPGDPTSQVLQDCASSSDKFFLVTSSNQVASVFTTIGTQLTKLRVSK